MIKLFFITPLFLTLLTLSSLVNAVEVSDLYQAEVIVSSQNQNDRNIALKKAMKAVLIKVGGQQHIKASVVINQALNNYNFYVLQYRYQKSNTQNFNKTAGLYSGTQASQTQVEPMQLMLIVSFDENKINQLLQQANIPLWGSLRPQIVLWMVEENQLTREILSESSPSTYPAIIQRYAQLSGLPLILPLMDLMDVQQINIADVWGRFSEPMLLASERYLAEAVVVMRISNSSLLSELEDSSACYPLCKQSHFVVDWTLMGESNKHSNQKYQGLNAEDLLKNAIGDITQVIYQRYALSSKNNNEFLIDVANVNNLVVYKTLIDFLSELSSVQSIQLVKATGSSRRFNLSLLGSPNAFLSSLKLNKQLQQYIDPLAGKSADDIPVFYWNK